MICNISQIWTHQTRKVTSNASNNQLKHIWGNGEGVCGCVINCGLQNRPRSVEARGRRTKYTSDTWICTGSRCKAAKNTQYTTRVNQSGRIRLIERAPIMCYVKPQFRLIWRRPTTPLQSLNGNVIPAPSSVIQEHSMNICTPNSSKADCLIARFCSSTVPPWNNRKCHFKDLLE